MNHSTRMLNPAIVVIATALAVVPVVRADGSGVSGERILHKEVVIPATPAEAWRAWTTSEGLAEWWVKESNIELRLLGPYELFLVPDAPEGQRGGESCRVLSFTPHTMFSFEWTFPPKVPNLRQNGEKTAVILHFDELDGGQVRVRFDQVGWGEGADWDAGYTYFDEAWSWVLVHLKEHFEKRAERTDRWIDGAVDVTAYYGKKQRQEFEIVIPADLSTVWDTLTTVDGVRSFLSPNPDLDMMPGGAYALFPGSTAKVLGVVPQRQLVVTGSAPLEFPNVRMGGTWAVLDFAESGPQESIVTMTCLGWKDGDEWDRAFEYFLKNNPVFLNLLRKRFTEGPLEWTDNGPDANPTFTRLSLK